MTIRKKRGWFVRFCRPDGIVTEFTDLKPSLAQAALDEIIEGPSKGEAKLSALVQYPSLSNHGTLLVTSRVFGSREEHEADAILVVNEEHIACVKDRYGDVTRLVAELLTPPPIHLILSCPMCSGRHIDSGVFATKPHHTHACQHCGHVWRPAIVPTVGVQFLQGFKNT